MLAEQVALHDAPRAQSVLTEQKGEHVEQAGQRTAHDTELVEPRKVLSSLLDLKLE